MEARKRKDKALIWTVFLIFLLGWGGPGPIAAAGDLRILAVSASDPTATHSAPDNYVPGGSVVVTNTFSYSDTLVSLLWRPHLPAGWTLQSITGDGNPELVSGEILWTGTLPPSPIHMTYTVQVPSGENGPKEIRGEVEYQLSGMVNPVPLYATPDPLILDCPLPSITQFSATPEAVSRGESTTLTWSIGSALTASIDPDVGTVNPVGGSVNVSPSRTTTYTLTATNLCGTAQATIKVKVRLTMAFPWLDLLLRD